MIAGEAVVVPLRFLRLGLGARAGCVAAGALVLSPATAAAVPSHHRHKPPPVPHSAPICSDDGQPGQPALTPAEVKSVALAAAGVIAAPPSPPKTIAVVDRAGNVLGLYRQAGAGAANDDLAIGLARTGAFFSNDQAPLSSRTVRFISGIHFPPGVSNTPNAALYGIENTNRGCTLSTNFITGQAIPPARSISGATTGLGITTGKANQND